MKAGRITPLDNRRNTTTDRMNLTVNDGEYSAFTDEIRAKYESKVGSTTRGQFEI